MPIDYLRELVEYWREKYDWRAREARLNQLSHFRTRIDGQSIHFIHARSKHPDAQPLLIIHGWPGSVVEFLDVIPRLTDPESHGGTAADAFHVVAPSLPGYGFSEPTRSPGWDVERIAHAFIELMARLGYARYASQGGDWGAQITTRIGAFDPEHCSRRPPEHAAWARLPRRRSPSPKATKPTWPSWPSSRRGSRPTRTCRPPSPRPSVRGSTIRRRVCSPGSSRSSAPGATATATRRTPSAAIS